MKVKTLRGGFFYDGRTISAGEELDVPKAVGENWVEGDLAEEVKPSRKAPKAQTGPEETR